MKILDGSDNIESQALFRERSSATPEYVKNLFCERQHVKKSKFEVWSNETSLESRQEDNETS